MVTNATLKFDGDLLTAKETEIIGEKDGLAVLKSSKIRTVAVHNGVFHADDVLAVAILRALFKGHIAVVRTRDAAKLEEVDLRLDVGEGLLDHHGKRAVPGVAACTRLLQLLVQTKPPRSAVEASSVNCLDKIVQAVAAWDTGDNSMDNPLGFVHALSQASSIKAAEADDPEGVMDAAFDEAVTIVTAIIKAEVTAAKAAAQSEEAANAAIKQQQGSPVVVFDRSCRWAPVKELIYNNADDSALYYVSPEKADDWRVLCCANQEEEEFSPFSSKKLIPEKFRGLRGDALSAAADIPDGVFCHAAGFIAGFKTRESAIKFAELCCKAE